MKARPRALLESMLHLGSGEMIGRLANIATVMWLGHRYGVAILGVYALAQSVTQYLQPLIDFGLRHVGARLVAVYPEAAAAIVWRVQRRRRLMAAAVLPLVAVYAAAARLPVGMKMFLVAFAAAGALYAVSLDWAAWGQGRLHLVGFAKSVVPVTILAFVFLARPAAGRVLWYAVAGNAAGFLLQGAFFRSWWRRQRESSTRLRAPEIVDDALAWQRTSVTGLAWLCYLAFNTIDVLMLGLMSNPVEVGLYSASYRVLNQVLATYYLLTQVLYPHFARHANEDRAHMIGPRILAPLFAAGLVIAAGISLVRRPVLILVFGAPFVAAAPLLLVLVWSIPLDFLTSYLSNAFLAWGLERRVLASTGAGAATNIVLNLVLIPAYGAWGAALNTLLSYGVLLFALYLAARTATEIGPRRPPGQGENQRPSRPAVEGVCP